MKLTWFGGKTMRVHLGGMILVVEPEGALGGISWAELTSGADRVVQSSGAELPQADGERWKLRPVPRVLDDDGQAPGLELWSLGNDLVLVDGMGEVPLLLAAGDVPKLGRWADGAVVVLFGDGEQMAARGDGVLAQRAPRLLALAGDDEAIDHAMAQLGGKLDGTGLVALQPGLAVEV